MSHRGVQMTNDLRLELVTARKKEILSERGRGKAGELLQLKIKLQFFNKVCRAVCRPTRKYCGLSACACVCVCALQGVPR